MAGTILIADAVVTNRIALRAKLTAACYGVVQATNAAEAEALLAREPLEAVMLGAALRDAETVELCARLRRRPEGADLPILVLTSDTSPAARVAALRAGADDVVALPEDAMSLLARLRSLIRSYHAAQELALRDGTERRTAGGPVRGAATVPQEPYVAPRAAVLEGRPPVADMASSRRLAKTSAAPHPRNDVPGPALLAPVRFPAQALPDPRHRPDPALAGVIEAALSGSAGGGLHGLAEDAAGFLPAPRVALASFRAEEAEAWARALGALGGEEGDRAAGRIERLAGAHTVTGDACHLMDQAEQPLPDHAPRGDGLRPPVLGTEQPGAGSISDPGAGIGVAAGLHAHIIALDPRALLSASGEDWDVVVLGLSPGPPEAGLPLLAELRSRRPLRHARVIAAVPNHALPGLPSPAELAARALDMGADAVVPAPPDPQELALRLAAQIRRKRVADQLRNQWREGMHAAITDPLTGLYNRRYALPYLARALEMSRRNGRDCAVLLADLDHFKRVNDRWGHAAGDAVLQAVANRLRDNLRAGDMVARIGGEEFLVVMPDTSRAEARKAAGRLCRLIRHPPVPLPDGGSAQVTVSIGLAVKTGAGETAGDMADETTGARAPTAGKGSPRQVPAALDVRTGTGADGGLLPGPMQAAAEVAAVAERLLAEADRALYRAKARGRNRVLECSPAA